MMNARTITPAALLAALALAGCSHDNDRLTLGDRTEQERVQLDSITSGPGIEPAAGPSITSIERTNWEPVTILSPPEHIGHDPHLTQLEPQYSSDRRHGDHPTADSALTLDVDQMAVAESLASVGWAGWDIIMMIPRAVAAPLRSPDEHYERYSQPTPRPEIAPAATPGA